MDFPFLQKTSLWKALSPLGKSIYTPKGIFYWSARARTEAEIDGTIGIAQDDDGTISHLAVAEPWAGAKIMERAAKAKVFAYAPIEGVETLRKKWLAKILLQHHTLENFATMPIVTNGITHSIALASRMFLETGQTLITADKSWENYEHIFSDTQGIKIETFPLFTFGDDSGAAHLRGNSNPQQNLQNTSGQALNIAAIIEVCKKVAISQKKVVLLLNFPHNQTGYMPSSRECTALGKGLQEFCKKNPEVPVVVLLDDAYGGYVYDSGPSGGQKHSPLSQIFAPLPNLTVVKMDGISKVMLAYGYRVGFITFFVNSFSGQAFSAEELSGIREEAGTKIGGLIRGEISQVGHHGQIFADALMDDWETVQSQRAQVIAMLGARWQAMTYALQAGYTQYGKQKMWADPCNGGFFCYINLAAGLDPKKIADRLMTEKKVGVVPSQQGLRVAFAGVPKAKIARMIERIFEVVMS